MSDPAPSVNDRGSSVTVRDFVAEQIVFGRYQLSKKLGQGGMGVVWKATDLRLNVQVALKFLSERVDVTPVALHGLRKETIRCRQLTHPNIIRIHDLEDDGTLAAISMELIDGSALSTLQTSQPAECFEASGIRSWIQQLVEGLDYAHTQAKIIHRDLKPANLMLTKDGNLKIADFGIARTLADSQGRVTSAPDSSGTLVYMSPQQTCGDKPAVADDVYSMGATLYDLLSGKPPFFTGNIQRQIECVVPPSIAKRREELGTGREPVPPVWERTIASCLAKDAGLRPASVREVERLLFGHAASAGPTGTLLDNTPAAHPGNIYRRDPAPVTAKAPSNAPASHGRGLYMGILLAAMVAAGWYWFAGQRHESVASSPGPQMVASSIRAHVTAEKSKELAASAPVAAAPKPPSSPVPERVASISVASAPPAPLSPTPQAPASPTSKPPPGVAKDQGFEAGDYVCVSGGTGVLSVTGPFPADEDRETWVYTGVINGTWTTGSVIGHPQLTTLPQDAILPKGWTFGLSTEGGLVAVRQLAERLIILDPRQTKDQWQRVEYVTQGASERIFQKRPPLPQ